MKNKFLFINYIGPGPDIYNLGPENGLALLAQVLKDHGYTAKILDFCTVSCYKTFFKENKNKIDCLLSQADTNILNFDNNKKLKQELNKILLESEETIIAQIFNEIRHFKPDYIGFKIWGGFGTSGSSRIAKRIKQEFPNITIIGGGPQTVVFKEDIMEYAPQFDYVIYGEGEESLPQLLYALKSGKSLKEVPSLIYNDGQIKINPRGEFIDISNISFPCYDLEVYPAMAEDKIKIFMLECSRGCPNRCGFCIHPTKSGNRYRIRDIDNVIDELNHISNKLKSKYFRITDSNPPQKNILKLAERMRGKGYTYSLFGHAHMKTDFNLLKESGCYAMFFGIESGSPYILDKLIEKGVSLDRLAYNLKESVNAGIYTVGTLIVPTPFDNDDTINETIEFIKKIKINALKPQLPYLEPETIWWDSAEKLGFKFSNKEFLKKKLLKYNISPVFCQLQEQLPYKINGFSLDDATRIIDRIISVMSSKGIAYDIGDFPSLCANAYGASPSKFAKITDNIFSKRDPDALEDLIGTINKNLEADYNKMAK